MNPVYQAAQLACIDIYDPVATDVFDKIYRINETVCGTKLIDNRLHVVMQGTESLPGWMADGDILPVVHPVLGHMHSGFWRNIPELLKELVPDIDVIKQALPGLEIQVEGHSKGAGEGAQVAGALHVAGYNVVQVYLFACPSPGFHDFAAYLQANIPGLSYRNAPIEFPDFGDPVPLMPIVPYIGPYPHTGFDIAPPGFERMLDVEWHRGRYYLSGAQGT